MQDSDISRLDGRLLKLFLSVYDLSSVTRAADALDVNQSTVSHGIERLRKALGDPLFVKSGRGIIATELAIRIAPTAREVVALLEGITETRDYEPSRDDRAVTIAANVSEIIPEVVRIRRLISARAPDLPVRFLELGSRENLVSLLENGKADIAITARLETYPKPIRSSEFIADRNVCFFDGAVRGPIKSVDDYARARHAVLDFGGARLSNVARVLEHKSIDRDVALAAPNTFALGRLIAGTDLVATMQSRLKHHVFSHLSYCETPFEMSAIYFDLAWHLRSDASARNLWVRHVANEAKVENDVIYEKRRASG